MANSSLRSRLVGTLVFAVVLAWVAVGALTYQDASNEIDAVLDAHLEQAAMLLAVQADHELFEVGAEGLGELKPYGSIVAFQVWDNNGKLLVRSNNAPMTRLSAGDAGFQDGSIGNRHWRVYSQWSAGHATLVQIAESREGRIRLARHFALHALWPLIVGLPLLAFLVWLAVTRALRPLVDLQTEVGRRKAADLHPLVCAEVPLEVVPLVEHLNALFDRIRGSMEAERRFTSHAAHELRTPIAAIRAQAESAIAAPGAAEARRALDQVIAACDRLSRLVTQLLTLARMDEGDAIGAPACFIDEIATRVIAEIAPAALEQGVEIGLQSATNVPVAADSVLLEVLIRNLVDNAVRYGGSGAHVEISIAQKPDGVCFAVVDDGAGVDEHDLVQLGRRFFRGSQQSGAGTGLGLSIVGRIAERCGADVGFSRPDTGRGLRVDVSFPLQGRLVSKP